DGNVRRKKVNLKHLEPLAQALELREKASHEDVKKAFEKSGWPVWERKAKETAPRPRKQKKVKRAAAAEKPLPETQKAAEKKK
ncbi:MAG: hypothetical protein Q8R53_00370, partial [Nanoarchaeota archaeon]|nr:hypothetical protein [Nanoarchaeota archaeon]